MSISPKVRLDDLLTTEQAAALLNVRPKTIRRWVYRREIPYLKIGRLIRFDRRKIEAWVECRTHEVAL